MWSWSISKALISCYIGRATFSCPMAIRCTAGISRTMLGSGEYPPSFSSMANTKPKHRKFRKSIPNQGGYLVLYGLLERKEIARVGFSLNGRPGLFIAFDSTVIHEVKPVMAGAPG